MYESGKAADKVDAYCFSRLIKCYCNRSIVRLLAGSRNDTDGCYGNTLIDNRNTEFLFDILANLNEILCEGCDFVIDFISGNLYVIAAAIEK